MSVANEQQIVATAREYVASLSLPYPNLVLRVGGAHAYGVATSNNRIVIDGLFVIPGREVMGIYPAPKSIRRCNCIHEQEVDFVADDVGHILGRIAQSEVVGFESLFGGGRDGWMLLDVRADINELFTIARDLLADTHVLDMLNRVADQRRRIIDRSIVYVQSAHDTIHHALMALCLAKTGEVIVPYNHLLAIASNHLRASTIGGIERFIVRMRVDGMRAELTKEERGEERGVGAWLQDIISVTNLALKERHLPPTPPVATIARANNFVVELRERVRGVDGDNTLQA